MIHDGVKPSSIQETGAQARLTTTRASKTVRQLAPSDREVAVVTAPSPQLPPSMVRLTALVIRSPVMLSPATVRNQRFSSVRVTWSGCSSTQGADAISTTATTKKKASEHGTHSKDDHPYPVRPVVAFGEGSL